MMETSNARTLRYPRGFRLAVAIIALLALASGALHGGVDGRWSSGGETEKNVKLLASIPAKVGDWASIEDEKLPPNAESMLQCLGYMGRKYQNIRTGNQISVVVLYGPRGPMAVHTPEVCYPSQGVKQSGGRRELVIDDAGSRHSFWRVNFGKADQLTTEVVYAWTDRSEWSAAKYPRVWAVPRLFKIQIAATPNTEDPEDFLRSFLPIWDKQQNEIH